MNARELLTLVAEVTIDSLSILRKVYLAPHRARAYADAFDLPPLKPSTEWLDGVEKARAKLEEEQYAQALSDALELIDSLVSFIEDVRADADLGSIDLLRRMFLPAVLFALRQDRDRGDDSKDQFGLRLLITGLLFLDDRAQEWYVSPSADERWFQFAKDVGGRLGYSGAAGKPFAIADAFFVGGLILSLALRGPIGRRLPLEEEPFSLFYGFEHPDDPERSLALAALSRTATLGIADLFGKDPLDEEDYESFDREPPTRPKGLGALTLAPLASEDGEGGALLIRSAGALDLDERVGRGWGIRASVGGGVNIVLPFGASPIDDLGGDPEVGATFEAYYDDEPSTLVDPSTPFAFHAARVRLGVRAENRELLAYVRVERGRVSIGRLPVLEFIAPEGFGFDVDAALIASTRDGLRFEGGGRSEVLIPVDKLLGARGYGLRVREIRIRWEQEEVDGRKTFRLVGTAFLGLEFKTVFRLRAEDVGGAFTLTFARNQPMRVASLVDIELEGVAPSGYAISVNWHDRVVGGGFLRRDPGTSRWVGAAEFALLDKWSIQGLVIRDVTPSGKESWLLVGSLLFPGTSPGISVRGISVVLATHRTSDPDAFLTGLRSGDLDALLFPEDPVGRGAQYAAALGRLLPLQDESEVVGVAVRIGALSGRLSIELGLLYDSGGPERAARILIVGQVDLVLPKKKAPVARIKADFVAVYDRERDEILVLAELRDSRLFGGVLTGQLVFFRGDPDLEDDLDERVSLLAIGGFHPSYTVPGPRVPSAQRVRLLVERGDRIRFDGSFYLAVTPTSLQFGAAMELRARFAGFGLRARLAADVLFHSLVRWEITVEASVEILLGSRTLMGVSLKGVLSGMLPAQLVGHVSVSFLFFSFSKSFTATLTVSEGEPDEERADPTEEVSSALADPRSWETGGAAGLALRDVDRPGVWMSPDAPLRVRQDVAPLDVPLARFGAAEFDEPVVLRVERVEAGAGELSFVPLRGEFAPALYQDLSEEEKLSGRGYSALAAGFSIERPWRTGAATRGDTTYEEVVLDVGGPPRRGRFLGLEAVLAEASRSLDDAARGRAPSSGLRPVRVREERFAVVDASLAPIAAGLDAASARAVSKTRRRAIVVPESDL